MLRLCIALCLYSFAACGEEDPLAAIERRQQALFERLGPSVVFISSEGKFGSGFFVTDGGLILTNAHVVGHSQTVQVVLADGRTFSGKVVERASNDVDLALLEVPVHAAPALTLAGKSDLRVGSWVAAVGHGRGGIWSFNTGMVSNIYSDGVDRPVFQTQIPLNPGNSGGPVVDRQGHVVGVVTAGIDGSNSINFAIRSEVALKSFARLEKSCACITISAPAGVPIFVDGKMAGTGPRLIVPAEPRAYEVFAVVGGTMRKARVRYPDQRAIDLK